MVQCTHHASGNYRLAKARPAGYCPDSSLQEYAVTERTSAVLTDAAFQQPFHHSYTCKHIHQRHQAHCVQQIHTGQCCAGDAQGDMSPAMRQ